MNVSSLHISPEILSLIAEIDEFKGAWRELGELAPEQLTFLKRVATIESIGSSTRIEGSKLTDREVEILLSNLQIQKFETRDEQAEKIKLEGHLLYHLLLGDLYISIDNERRLAIYKSHGRLQSLSRTGHLSLKKYLPVNKSTGIIFNHILNL